MTSFEIKALLELLGYTTGYRFVGWMDPSTGMYWTMFVGFENDPNGQRFGGGLELNNVSTYLGKIDHVMKLTEYARLASMRTLYVKRTGEDSIQAGVEYTDGLGAPKDSLDYGVPMLPRPYELGEPGKPLMEDSSWAFSQSMHELLVSTWSAQPSTRRTAHECIRLVPAEEGAGPDEVGSMQFSLRMRFQLLNYQAVCVARFYSDSRIFLGVEMTGPTNPSSPDTQTRLHLHLPVFVVAQPEIQGIDGIDIGHVVHDTSKDGLPLVRYLMSSKLVLHDDLDMGHLHGAYFDLKYDANNTKLDQLWPGTKDWYDSVGAVVMVEWEQSQSELPSYFKNSGWRLAVSKVISSKQGQDSDWGGKVAAIVKAPAFFVKPGAVEEGTGVHKLLLFVQLCHAHIPMPPDAILTPGREMGITLSARGHLVGS